MPKVNTAPPSGTRDFLPNEVKFREWVFDTIRQAFEAFGFLPLETPALERLETLLGKYGEEGEKLVFKILRRGERGKQDEVDLALRYDLTIPLARIVAEYQSQLPPIFRRYQIGPVWRADRPGQGRLREFFQCDVDVVGSSSPLADAEAILALTEALTRLTFSDFTVRLNSRKVLAGLLEAYAVPSELRRGVLTTLDKLDKVGPMGVERELRGRIVPAELAERIGKDLCEPPERVIEMARTTEIGREGLAEIEDVTQLVAPCLKSGRIEFVPFLARGLEYYTGPIFEIFTPGAAGGSIAGGGRYDDLIGSFTSKRIPACGGSLGIERVLLLLREAGTKWQKPTGPQTFITVWDRTFRQDAIRIASELRTGGITTEVYLGEGKIGNQLRDAAASGALYGILFGPEEKAAGEVSVKNLATQQQTKVGRDQLLANIQQLLQQR